MNMTSTYHIHPMWNLTCLTWTWPDLARPLTGSQSNRITVADLCHADGLIHILLPRKRRLAAKNSLLAGWSFSTPFMDGSIKGVHHNFAFFWTTKKATKNTVFLRRDSWFCHVLSWRSPLASSRIQEHSWTRTEGTQRSTLVFIVLLATGARDDRRPARVTSTVTSFRNRETMRNSSNFEWKSTDGTN